MSPHPPCLVAALFALALGTAAAQAEAHSAVTPQPQPGGQARHEEKVRAAAAANHDLLLIGDSISHNLDLPAHREVWEQFFAPRHALVLATSGARTENILWNLANGELENQTPKAAVVLIGTNNTDDANYPDADSPEEVAGGVQAIVELLRARCPQAKILLLRIFPRENVYRGPDGGERGSASARAAANLRAGELIAGLADGGQVRFMDLNHVFLRDDGTLNPELVPDLLHPGVEGTRAWVEALEPALAEAMGDTPRSEPPANPALVPVPKLENDSYDWQARHQASLDQGPELDPEIVLLGDSITHFWGGPPQSGGTPPRGPESFARLFGEHRVLNLGFGWDRTQNLLWRLDHGELDGLHPRLLILNIGTNNFARTAAHPHDATPREVADGIRAVIRRLRAKAPQAEIILNAVFPRGDAPDDPRRRQIDELNAILAAEWTGVPGVTFLDLGQRFLRADGGLNRDLLPDGVHPNEVGYAQWAEALQPRIEAALEPAGTVQANP